MNQQVLREEALVLIAEDEPLVRAFAEAALVEGGYAVVIAKNGAEALGILDARSAQLSGLITDIRLGAGPDGWEVAHHARELRSDIAVVYTSGDSAHDWASQGVPNSLVLQKPFASGQLVTAVSSLMTAADTSRAS